MKIDVTNHSEFGFLQGVIPNSCNIFACGKENLRCYSDDPKKLEEYIEALGGKEAFLALPVLPARRVKVRDFAGICGGSINEITPKDVNYQPITRGFDRRGRLFLSFCVERRQNSDEWSWEKYWSWEYGNKLFRLPGEIVVATLFQPATSSDYLRYDGPVLPAAMFNESVTGGVDNHLSQIQQLVSHTHPMLKLVDSLSPEKIKGSIAWHFSPKKEDIATLFQRYMEDSTTWETERSPTYLRGIVHRVAQQMALLGNPEYGLAKHSLPKEILEAFGGEEAFNKLSKLEPEAVKFGHSYDLSYIGEYDMLGNDIVRGVDGLGRQFISFYVEKREEEKKYVVTLFQCSFEDNRKWTVAGHVNKKLGLFSNNLSENVETIKLLLAEKHEQFKFPRLLERFYKGELGDTLWLC